MSFYLCNSSKLSLVGSGYAPVTCAHAHVVQERLRSCKSLPRVIYLGIMNNGQVFKHFIENITPNHDGVNAIVLHRRTRLRMLAVRAAS